LSCADRAGTLKAKCLSSGFVVLRHKRPRATPAWWNSGRRVFAGHAANARGGALPITLKKLRLAEGEARTLNVTKASVPEIELAQEVVEVSVFTPEGLQLPGCEIQIADPRGPRPLPKPTHTQGSTSWFALPPGSYTVVASYLGAESGTQTVEVRPVLKDGNWTTHDHVVTLTLAPIE
jgi:hypothetical protein